MQPLPRGITGFDNLGQGVPFKQFTAACHIAMRELQGRVLQVHSASDHVAPNFHEAVVNLRDRAEPVRILCNASHPMVAFAVPTAHVGDAQIQFLDCPELAEVLNGEFSVISAKDAVARITSELVALLGQDELAQMRYWKPQRVGDLIFNYWD